MKRTLIALATVSTLGLSALAAPAVFAHGPGQGPAAGNGWGPGMMGYGGHPMGYPMGSGMMGYGMGPAMMGANGAPCPGLTTANADGDPLTVDQARKNMQQRLEWMGNDRLKVGTVEAKDDNTISAEIVTVDGSLVEKFDINRKTGFMQPVQ